MDVKMPYNVEYTATEEPEDFGDKFNETIDLYYNFIVQAQEIYHYLNEKGYYPKSGQLKGSGRLPRPQNKKLKNRFTLLNAEKTPRFTGYVVNNGVAPLRSKLYGGMAKGNYSRLANLNKAALLQIIHNYNLTVSKPNQIPLTGNETNKQMITMIKTVGVNLDNPDIYKPKDKTLTPIKTASQAFEEPEQESESDEEPYQTLSESDEEESKSERSELQEEKVGEPEDVLDYKFETNPIFGIINKMFMIVNKLSKYEKYLLKYYNFLDSEKQNELAKNYKELIKFYELVFYESDKKLNFKVKKALDDLKVQYLKVIQVLADILKINNFDISVVESQEAAPGGAYDNEVDYDSDSSDDSTAPSYDRYADWAYRKWFENTRDDELAPRGFADLGPPVEPSETLYDLQLPPTHKPKAAEVEEYDLPLPPSHKPKSKKVEDDEDDLGSAYKRMLGKGMHRKTPNQTKSDKLHSKTKFLKEPKSPFIKPCIIERVNKWTYNERPNMTKYLL